MSHDSLIMDRAEAVQRAAVIKLFQLGHDSLIMDSKKVGFYATLKNNVSIGPRFVNHG